MTHHTIRDESPASPSSTPSLTPATDSAHRVIAAGQLALADKLALKGTDGCKARVSMALQNAYLLAISAEVDAGAGKTDLHIASTTAIGCIISQSIGMIFAGAPEAVKQAALFSTIDGAARFAVNQVAAGPAVFVDGCHETVRLTQTGAA